VLGAVQPPWQLDGAMVERGAVARQLFAFHHGQFRRTLRAFERTPSFPSVPRGKLLIIEMTITSLPLRQGEQSSAIVRRGPRGSLSMGTAFEKFFGAMGRFRAGCR
jgi:hypothetical protein